MRNLLITPSLAVGLLVLACGSGSTANDTDILKTDLTGGDQVQADSCEPDCLGKSCGHDGCGGTCGSCDGDDLCYLGTCIADCTDNHEPDDDMSMAHGLEIDVERSHSICPTYDEDWFRISLNWEHDLTMEIQSEGGEVEAGLFEADGTTLVDDEKSHEGALLLEEGVTAGDYYFRVVAKDSGQVVQGYTVLLKAVCKPNCDQKDCGDDGCGGSCGDCGIGFDCTAGACVEGCIEDQFEPDNDAPGTPLFEGAPSVEHSICPVEDVDWFGFTLAVFSNVDVEIWTTAADVEAWLYDSGMIQMDHDDSENAAQMLLSENELAPGTYLVKVAADHSGDVVPSYLVELRTTCAPQCSGLDCGDDGCGGSCGECEPGLLCSVGTCMKDCADDVYEPADNVAPGTPLFDGIPQTDHSVCPVDDEDWYRFILESPSDLWVEAASATGDVEMWLYDEEMVEMDHDDTGATTPATLEVGELPPGAYLVKLTSDHAGDVVPSYQIELRTTCVPQCDGKDCGSDGCGDTCDDCSTGFICEDFVCVGDCDVDAYEPDEAAQGKTLENNVIQTDHSICPVDDQDWYVFTLTVKSDFEIESSSTTGDVEMWLYDDQNNQLDHDDASATGMALMDKGPLDPGIYRVRVSADHAGEVVPSYQIELRYTDW